MQIFKLFFKVVMQNVIWVILMFTFVFALLTALYYNNDDTHVNVAFDITKASVAVADEDHSELSRNLVAYIDQHTQLKDAPKTENEILDSFFYGALDCYLVIPKGFGEHFGTESQLSLSSRMRPGSSSGTMINVLIEGYLSAAQLYHVGNGIDFTLLNDAMEKTSDADILNNNSSNELSSFAYLYNFMAYPLTGIVLFSVTFIMMVFSNKDLLRRNFCSPVSSERYHRAMFLGNTVLAFFVFLVYNGIGFVYFGTRLFEITGLLHILSTFVFTATVLSMGFLLSMFVKKNTVTAIVNIISMAMSFFGGAFVPQSLLKENIGHYIGLFLPSYWYIYANNSINGLTVYTWETLQNYWMSLLTLVGFLLLFSLLTMVIQKKRVTAEN